MGGTVFKRHTSALDRPGGTLSLRPLQMALEGHDSGYGYHHQTFGIHLVVLTAHWAFNMRAPCALLRGKYTPVVPIPMGLLAFQGSPPPTSSLPLGTV